MAIAIKLTFVFAAVTLLGSGISAMRISKIMAAKKMEHPVQTVLTSFARILALVLGILMFSLVFTQNGTIVFLLKTCFLLFALLPFPINLHLRRINHSLRFDRNITFSSIFSLLLVVYLDFYLLDKMIIVLKQ